MQIFVFTDNKINSVFYNIQALVDSVCDCFITHIFREVKTSCSETV